MIRIKILLDRTWGKEIENIFNGCYIRCFSGYVGYAGDGEGQRPYNRLKAKTALGKP